MTGKAACPTTPAGSRGYLSFRMWVHGSQTGCLPDARGASWHRGFTGFALRGKADMSYPALMAGTANILVTGGTGFIGRYVVRLLIRQGQRVRVLCRAPAKARRLFGETATLVEGDLLDPASLERACRGAETVLNLGGLYEFGARHRHALWETNVIGTNHLLAACWQARVEKVVH